MAVSEEASGEGSGEFWQGVEGTGRGARLGRIGVGLGIGAYSATADGVSAAFGGVGYLADGLSFLHLLPGGVGRAAHGFAGRIDADREARSSAYHAEYDRLDGSWSNSLGYVGGAVASLFSGGVEAKALSLAGKAASLGGRALSHGGGAALRAAAPLFRGAASAAPEASPLLSKVPTMSIWSQGARFVEGGAGKLARVLPARTAAKEAEAGERALTSGGRELVADGAAPARKSFGRRAAEGAGRGALGVGKAGLGSLGAAGLGAVGLGDGGFASRLGGMARNLAVLYAVLKLVKGMVEKYVIGEDAMKGTDPGMIDVAKSKEALAHAPAVAGAPGLGDGVGGARDASPRSAARRWAPWRPPTWRSARCRRRSAPPTATTASSRAPPSPTTRPRG